MLIIRLVNQMSDALIGFLISGDGDKVEQLLDRFKRLREQFHLGIGAETHKMMCMTGARPT